MNQRSGKSIGFMTTIDSAQHFTHQRPYLSLPIPTIHPDPEGKASHNPDTPLHSEPYIDERGSTAITLEKAVGSTEGTDQTDKSYPFSQKPAVRLSADVADGADGGAEMTPAGAGENLTWQVHGASCPSS
jgi:hypothetical protein